MKEIDKKDTPDVSGGWTPGDSGCVPIGPFPVPVTTPMPEDPIGYPSAPGSTPRNPFITDPPAA